jgi:hypothetical protein
MNFNNQSKEKITVVRVWVIEQDFKVTVLTGKHNLHMFSLHLHILIAPAYYELHEHSKFIKYV